MAKKLNWGIMGCGHIAQAFAKDLVHSRWGTFYAAASRTSPKAADFCRQFKGQTYYGSYEELVDDPRVDVIYVATPHPFHMDNAILALTAGKPVLCEKPLTVNARQTQKLIKTAAQNGLFLMEGMWTRFFPAMVRLRKWLSEGRIGRVLMVQADFGVQFQAGPEHRIYNPHLGGGALLDLGIYPISFASMVYGQPPQKIHSAAHFCQTGVDDQAAITFQYAHDAMAVLGCSSRVVYRQEARVYGEKGKIIVNENFYRPHSLTLQLKDKKPRTVVLDHPGHGFHFEADHVAQCLRKGQLQSDIMPQQESLTIMKTMDRIRRQWKMKYPGE